MGKDIEDTGDDETLVDQTTNEVDSGNEVPETIADKKPSIREALKHAFTKEKEETDQEEKTPKKAPKEKVAQADTKTEDGAENADDTSEVSEKVAKEVTEKPKTEVKAPVGWTKEAKAVFNTLPDVVKASIAKREEEVSNGFKQYGEQVSKYKEMDEAIAPYRAEITQFGQTEAQTVSKLFSWMKALTNPDRNYALQQFVQLGRNFGIELPQPSNAAPQNTTQGNQNPPDNTQPEIPAPLKTFMDTVSGEINSLKGTIEQQKEQEAKRFVDNWAKDKPHFNTVRAYMFSLLNGGTIPLKDGGFDLDAAYDAAVYANPTTRELLRQEQEQKAVQEAEANRKKAETARLAKLYKAKAANVSIPNRAPSGVAPAANAGKGKGASIRDSIRAAIQEVRED